MEPRKLLIFTYFWTSENVANDINETHLFVKMSFDTALGGINEPLGGIVAAQLQC